MLEILSLGFAAGAAVVFIPRVLMLPAILFKKLISK